jgi:hypothetical protein
MKTNTQTMSNKIEQIRALLGLKPTKFAEATLVDGTVIGTDADSFEDGVLVYITGDDGEKMPLPSGDYELADGSTISIVDGEIKGKEEPKGADETAAGKDNKEEKAEKEEDLSSEVDLSAYALKSELIDSLELMMSKIEELETKLSAIDGLSEELNSVKKLSAEKPFKHSMSPSQKVADKKAIMQMSSHDRVREIFNARKNK